MLGRLVEQFAMVFLASIATMSPFSSWADGAGGSAPVGTYTQYYQMPHREVRAHPYSLEPLANQIADRGMMVSLSSAALSGTLFFISAKFSNRGTRDIGVFRDILRIKEINMALDHIREAAFDLRNPSLESLSASVSTEADLLLERARLVDGIVREHHLLSIEDLRRANLEASSKRMLNSYDRSWSTRGRLAKAASWGFVPLLGGLVVVAFSREMAAAYTRLSPNSHPHPQIQMQDVQMVAEVLGQIAEIVE